MTDHQSDEKLGRDSKPFMEANAMEIGFKLDPLDESLSSKSKTSSLSNQDFNLGIPQSESALHSNLGYQPFKDECAENAQIWKIYQSKAAVRDEHLKGILNSDLDSLLIFAGLFSAVLSAFLIEVRKGLQEDLQATTNALLQALLQSQNGGTASFSSPVFHPSPSSRIVNGLWFSSLVFSLMSALGASLAKSWVAEYASAEQSANWEDASRRHRRFVGISRWHLQVVIRSLPIPVHIAFFLFSVGLVILLLDDDLAIGFTVLVLTAAAALLYLGSAVLPVLTPDFPYQTPISAFIVRAGRAFKPQERSQFAVDTLKARLLLWLYKICVGSGDVDVVVKAMAGLERSPQIQEVLYDHQLITTLSDRLSTLSTQNTEPDLLKAYLYTLLHLVQADCPDLQSDDMASAKKQIILLTERDSLFNHYDTLDPGIRAIAISIKARVLLFYKDDFTHPILNIDIPLLLKTTTEDSYLLQEVYLLSNNSHLRDQLRNANFNIRMNAFNRLRTETIEAMRRHDIMTYNAEILIKGVESRAPEISVKYLMALETFIVTYPDICDQFISVNGMEKVLKRLEDQDGDLRKNVLNAFGKLCANDNIRSKFLSLDAIHNILQNLHDPNKVVRLAALEVLGKLCAYDEVCRKFVCVDGTQMIIGKFEDQDGDVRRTALGVLTGLCANDKIRVKMISMNGIQTVISKLDDPDNSVIKAALRALQGLCTNDDNRNIFNRVDGLRNVIGKLEAQDKNVRKCALNVLEELCNYGDTRTKFISLEGVTNILKSLDQEEDDYWTTLNTLQKLCDFEDIRSNFITFNGVQKLLELLEIPGGRMNRSILIALATLGVYDDFRCKLLLEDGIVRIMGRFEDQEWTVRMEALDTIKKLSTNEEIRNKFTVVNVLQLVVGKLDDEHDYVRKYALDALGTLCSYDDMYRVFFSLNGIQRILEKLEDRGGYSDVYKHASDALVKLFTNDNICDAFISMDGFQDVLKKLKDSKDPKNNLHAPLDAVKASCTNDLNRRYFISNNAIERLLEILDDPSYKIVTKTLDILKVLCTADDIRLNSALKDSINKILEKDSGTYAQKAVIQLCDNSDVCSELSMDNMERIFEQLDNHRDWDVRGASLDTVKTICANDNIRSRFISAGGVQKIVQKVGGVNTDASDALESLCTHDDIRKEFISQNYIHTILGFFDDWAVWVRKCALDSTRKICTNDDILKRFIDADGIQNVLKMLEGKDSEVIFAATECLQALAEHDIIRIALSTPLIISALARVVQRTDTDVEKAATLIVQLVESSDDTALVEAAIESVPILLQSSNAHRYGLNILTAIAKRHESVIKGSQILPILRRMVGSNMNDTHRVLVGLEALLILRWF